MPHSNFQKRIVSAETIRGNTVNWNGNEQERELELEDMKHTTNYLISQIFQSKVQQLLRAKKSFSSLQLKTTFLWLCTDVRTTAALVVFFLLFVLSSPSFRNMKEKWRVNVESFIFSNFNSWNSELFFWNYLWCIPLPWDLSSTWATQPNCSSFWVCGQRVRLHNLK